MTNAVASLRAVARLTLRRMRTTMGLLLASVVASAALVAIWVGIPLYAESATASLLTTQVDEADSSTVPFGYLFSFNRLSGGNQSWSALQPVNDYLVAGDTPFGSAVRANRQYVETVPFDLVADPDTNGGALGRAGFSSLTQVAESVVMVAGAAPADTSDGLVEAMISEAMAAERDLSVGQELTVVGPQPAGVDVPPSVAVRISGIWSLPAGDLLPEDRFLRSGPMRESLVVTEAAFATGLAPLGDAVVSNAQWLVLLDSSTVTTDTVDGLLGRTDDINRAVDDRLAGTRLLISPERSLVGYQDEVERVNNGLGAFSVPTLALVVFVAGLVAAMSWSQRAAETDLLRRRGVSAHLIVASSAIEAVIIAALALLVGLGLAIAVASVMVKTSTFLHFDGGIDLAVSATSRAQGAAVGVAVLVVALQLAPSLGVYRWSGRTLSRRAETRLGAPWWQRVYLDVAVIAAVGFFAWFVLRSDALRGDLLDDPVVILLPAALSVAAGLVVLRVLPPLLERLGRLLERTNSTSLLLVVRRAARVPTALAAPLMLLVVTGALSVYTASLARTLDLQLLDQAYHQVGGANSVVGDDGGESSIFELVNGRPRVVRGAGGPPVDPSAYARVWGLDSATRLAQLPARAIGVGGSTTIPVELTAIDTSTFAGTAFWRDDYATQPLTELLDRLDATPDGVLMRRQAMRSNSLRVGDVIDVVVTVGNRGVDIPMVIVGTFDQFPTWTPSNEFTPIVVSLGDLEARVGFSVARRVIFSRDQADDAGTGLVDDLQTRADLHRVGVASARVESAADIAGRAQTRPERQGVFGLLTVSFVLSSLLTLAAFVFYAAFGFTQQLTEVGMLRAVGLKLRSLFILVGCDLLLVALVGTGAAVLTGVGMARVVLPRLVGTRPGAAPVLLQETDWAATIAIAVALVLAFVLVTALVLAGLRRIRLFEAIKLGAS